jgi:hypothetical protein
MDNAKPKDIMQQLDEGITALGTEVKELRLENFRLLTKLNQANTQMMIIEDAIKMVKTLSEKEIEDWRVNHYKNDPIQKPLVLTKDMEVKDNGHK